MNIAVIGLGLIGGSMALSIQRHTEHTVFGADINADTLDKALLRGAVDEELTPERLRRCELVLIALYPGQTVEYIRAHAEDFAEGALVIDCCGVKRAVMEPVTAIAEGRPWTYIGGHPMAGREFSGFRYATDALFDRASMLLVPPSGTDPEQLARAKAFFLSLGFGLVRITTPAEHDAMIAFTSQLAHIVSSAYVKNPSSQRHKGFSAGSFLDMTRVARLNEGMWTELFLDNADLLLPAVDDLIFRLREYRDALDARDEDALRALLKDGREKKEALDE